MKPLLLKVDCHSLPVPSLDEGIAFYQSLGHEVIWRDTTAAGLRLPDDDAELVLHTDERPTETDFTVESVPAAVERFCGAGGHLIHGPFDIRIGRCAVMLDPWNNPIVLLDNSKGLLEVDSDGNIVGNKAGT